MTGAFKSTREEILIIAKGIREKKREQKKDGRKKGKRRERERETGREREEDKVKLQRPLRLKGCSEVNARNYGTLRCCIKVACVRMIASVTRVIKNGLSRQKSFESIIEKRPAQLTRVIFHLITLLS